MRIPILAAVGLVLALVGVLGYTVIFPTMMSISGQDFISQASEDANNNQNFKDYDSGDKVIICLLYTSPSPRDRTRSRMPSSA